MCVGREACIYLKGQDAITESENFRVERNPRDHPIQFVSTLHFTQGNGGPDRCDDLSRVAKTVNSRPEAKKWDLH